MSDFEKILLFHTLCCAADKMLNDKAITLKEYYFLIKKSSKCVIISPKQSISPHFLKIATHNYYLFTTGD